jgi:ADP-ribose pyrophosphatase YjhB (NUDIX family)
MELKSHFTHEGKVYTARFVDEDPNSNLNGAILHGVHCYCFYKNKLVVVFDGSKNRYTPPGGGMEKGETYIDAVVREIKEESNMKVIYQKFIGYQENEEHYGIGRQARVFCIVEPYGDFISDPDNDITQIELIDPKDYKKYFDWGVIGDELMKRAVEMKTEYDKI